MKLFRLLLICAFLIPAPTLASPRVVTLLQELIQADTTNPPGNEVRAVEVLEKWLRQAPQIQLQRFESAPGRMNLVARLPGHGKKAPLILLGHLDVVTANPDEWDVPPYKGVVKDGFVWGRGAIDMKGMVAMEAELMLQLAGKRSSLEGDLYLVAVADEETGGQLGAAQILEAFPELLKAGGIINEGSIGMRRKEFDIFPIQVAEKGVCWLKLTATGPSGHGSMPDRKNAVLALTRAIQTIGTYRFPLQSTEVMKEFLGDIAPRLSFPASLALQHLFTPLIGHFIRPMAAPRIAEDKAVYAMLTNTAAPTILKAGSKINVIPNEAVGYVDARILPGETPEGFRDFLQGLVGDAVQIEIVTSSLPNESPRDTALYKVFSEVLKRRYPEAVVTPVMSTGATDSRFFRSHGIPAYGLIPVLLPEEDLAGLHGKNERIPLDSLTQGVEILREVVEGVL